MKLSEAVMIGSVTIPQGLSCQFDGTEPGTAGCAYAMACDAVGISRTFDDAVAKWKWIYTIGHTVKYPCGCETGSSYPINIIWHIFDEHVAADRNRPRLPSWTIEQLADWIQSVEPPEVCSECRSEQPVNEIQVCQECQPSL